MHIIYIYYLFTLLHAIHGNVENIVVEEEEEEGGGGGGGEDSGVIYPVIACEDILLLDLTKIPNAPTRVVDARVHIDIYSNKYFCYIQGYISGQISFILALPNETYQGRYVQLGVGSFGGYNIPILVCGESSEYIINGTVAYSQNDAGHVSEFPEDGVWASNQLSLRTDYAYQSEVLMQSVALYIINLYYNSEAEFKYFFSCSNGGRQAEVLMQRFPQLFDGYGANSAVTYPAALALRHVQTYALNYPEGTTAILTSAKIPALYNAVLNACDGLDGLVDQEITDPNSCSFDPIEIQCPLDEDNDDCLTPDQVSVVRKLYQGFTDPDTSVPLYPGGAMRGSEPLWTKYITEVGAIPQAELGLTLLGYYGLNYMRYLATILPQPSLQINDIDFNIDTLNQLDTMNLLYHSSSPNIDDLMALDIKVILSHGLIDNAVPPNGTIAYWQALKDRYGDELEDNLILVLIPGFGHCGYPLEFGSNNFSTIQIDLLTPLIDWVEKGIPPSRMIASNYPLASQSRTRPVFPFPDQARYNGSGSINNEANFIRYTPPPQDYHISWAGLPLPKKYTLCEWTDNPDNPNELGPEYKCKLKRHP